MINFQEKKDTYTTSNLNETENLAKLFLEKILNIEKNRAESAEVLTAMVVGFSGDLGAGKTTFTQAVARLLGVSSSVTSPTFVIEKRYEVSSEAFLSTFTQLIHIDAYRLDGGKELIKLDFQELLNDPKKLIIIEWPEKVQDVLPKDLIMVDFKWVDDTVREITF